jgi:hypothetical protein
VRERGQVRYQDAYTGIARARAGDLFQEFQEFPIEQG